MSQKMWNKKAEEDSHARHVATAHVATPHAATLHAATAVEPVSVRSVSGEPSRLVAVLGKSVVVKGEIYCQEDLTIDGEVQGTVDAEGHRLTIGPNGKVKTEGVKARELVVMGTMNGSVEATEKVYIRKDAQLVGDVQTAGIVIEDGAYFKGGIDIRKP